LSWSHPGFVVVSSWFFRGLILVSSWSHPGFAWSHPGFWWFRRKPQKPRRDHKKQRRDHDEAIEKQDETAASKDESKSNSAGPRTRKINCVSLQDEIFSFLTNSTSVRIIGFWESLSRCEGVISAYRLAAHVTGLS